MALEIGDLKQKARLLENRYIERDRRMEMVRLVRQGKADYAFPGLFSVKWPKPVVANLIEVASKSAAEMAGVLPTITATGDSSLDPRRRSKSSKRTKIANLYIYQSKLGVRLPEGADRYNTYGFLPFRVEADFVDKRPHIIIEDPYKTYPEWDRFGRLQSFSKKHTRTAAELAAMFPEYRALILSNSGYSGGEMQNMLLDVWRYMDKDEDILFIPQKSVILSRTKNHLSRIPVVVARAPSIDEQTRGTYDQTLWTWIARAYMAQMTLKATQDAVEAPISLPNDVDELAIGPNSIIRSDQPQNVRRVGLDVPQAAFAEGRLLADELKTGARFSDIQQGISDASIVTGQGVKALQSGWDQRIKETQSIFADAMTDVISLCFEMDEVYFPGVYKDVHVTMNGTPTALTYTPAKDIAGEWGVECVHGIMSGQDPNRSLVFGLQARGDKLISRDFLRRNMPVDMDVNEEARAVDIEMMRDILINATAQYASAIPQLLQQGGEIDKVVSPLAQIIKDRTKGVNIEDAILKAFDTDSAAEGETPGAPEPGEADQSAPGQAPLGGGQDQGMGGAPPPMADLLARLGSNGQANMSVSRRGQVPG